MRAWSFLFCHLTDVTLRVYIFLKKHVFVFDSERKSTIWEGAERGRQKISSRLCAVSAEPDGGLGFTNCKIMT